MNTEKRRKIVEQRQREDQEYDAALRAKEEEERLKREQALIKKIKVGNQEIEYHLDHHAYTTIIDNLKIRVHPYQQVKGSLIEPFSAKGHLSSLLPVLMSLLDPIMPQVRKSSPILSSPVWFQTNSNGQPTTGMTKALGGSSGVAVPDARCTPLHSE